MGSIIKINNNMRSIDFIIESAVTDLAKRLPSLEKHDYTTIDKLMRGVASRHSISRDALHDLFVKKFHRSPDNWVKNKLDETDTDITEQPIVQQFIKWASDILKLKTQPEIEFSYDTDEAQQGHHTGRHTEGSNKVWIYARNRNLVDIFRTIFHELVHVRQGELNMITPGSSYPGSPIEAQADVLAGKYIKIFGKDHPEIFQ
jgi:hypothetical protein